MSRPEHQNTSTDLANIILITGTPGVGKSIIAAKLSKHLDCRYVDISTLVKTKKLYDKVDERRGTLVASQRRLRAAINMIIQSNGKRPFVISTHYLGSYLSARRVRYCFVLRLNPEKLRQRLVSRKWSRAKINENVEAELIGVCLSEALGQLAHNRVHEIDTTGKSWTRVLKDITDLVDGKKKFTPNAGTIDWLRTYK
jgi:adenylate kinase